MKTHARHVVVALLVALVAVPALAQEESGNRLRDPEDGWFDLSRYLLESTVGFFPIPFVITEPAVGTGIGGAGAFFHPPDEPSDPDSDDGFNRIDTWRSIIVVPVSTSAKQTARGPTAVSLPKGAGGLAYDSVALCHQVTTLDRAKLNKKLGVLTSSELIRIDRGLQAALDINE